nr:uncharacterized protein LOC113704345 [Coffea arabica]
MNKRSCCEIEEEMAALRTKIEELKELGNRFIPSTMTKIIRGEVMEFVAHLKHHYRMEMYKDSSIGPWNSCSRHFCHRKPFEVEAVSFYQKEDERDAIYGCKESGFFLHEICAQFQLPQEWNHSCHSEDPLSLYEVESGAPQKFQCHLCESNGSNFVYHCAICKFSIDLLCINLKPTKKLEVHAPENNHRHPLFIFEAPFVVDFRCSFCHSHIYGTVCLDSLQKHIA